jgi:hypothetical protein
MDRGLGMTSSVSMSPPEWAASTGRRSPEGDLDTRSELAPRVAYVE